MCKMKKICFCTNIIPHYRVSFYEKLSNIQNLKFIIIHGVQKKNSGRPSVFNHNFNFKTQSVINKEVKVGPYEIIWQKHIFKILKNEHPDLIILLGISGIISNWFIALWAKIKKVKIIIWACGWESQNVDSLYYLIKRFFLKIYFRFPDIILVYSNKAKKYIESLGISADKISVCYNGIETDNSERIYSLIKEKSVELRRKDDIDDQIIFLYVGGMLHEKKIDILLKAFCLVENKIDSVLWIVGDGPKKEYLISLSKKMGIKNIKFWGRIVEEVDIFFSAADIFVLPGIGGLALNQAMYWETPCICSEADGTEDDLVLNNITGFRFEKNDYRDLSKVMLNAAKTINTKKIDIMKLNCKEMIKKKYNVDNMILKFNDSINRLLV